MEPQDREDLDPLQRQTKKRVGWDILSCKCPPNHPLLFDTVHFPYSQPYQIQKQIISGILEGLDQEENILIEAPTGSGKTVSLLTSVLSWAHENHNKGLNSVNKVIYMSKSHTQLTQLDSELSKTCYRPKMVVQGSRKLLCVNQQVLKEKDGKVMLKKCKQKIQLAQMMKKLSLQDLFEVYGFTVKELENLDKPEKKQCNTDELSLNSSKCPYYQTDFSGRISTYKSVFDKIAKKPLTIQHERQSCKDSQVCPYLYPYTGKYYANLIVMPYNYILDRNLIKQNEKFIQDSILIFDEGHNVASAAAQGMDIMLKPFKFIEIISNIKKLLKLKDKQRPEKVLKIEEEQDDIDYLEGKDAKKNLDFQPINLQQLGFTLIDIINQFKNGMEKYLTGIKNQYINNTPQIELQDSHIHFVENSETKKAMVYMFTGNKQGSLVSMLKNFAIVKRDLHRIYLYIKAKYEFKPRNLSDFIQFLDEIEQYCTDTEYSKHFGMFLNFENLHDHDVSHHKLSIKLKCFNPAFMFQRIINLQPKSIIITSGTLKPFENWSKNLGIDFKTIDIGNNHIISPYQILTLNIKTINNHKALMIHKNINENVKDVFKIIKIICNCTKGGILVVMPSGKWKDMIKTIYQQHKHEIHQQFYFEQKYGNINTLIRTYKDACQEHGAVLVAYARGSLNEGILSCCTYCWSSNPLSIRHIFDIIKKLS